jgi:hypothetical protein
MLNNHLKHSCYLRSMMIFTQILFFLIPIVKYIEIKIKNYTNGFIIYKSFLMNDYEKIYFNNNLLPYIYFHFVNNRFYKLSINTIQPTQNTYISVCVYNMSYIYYVSNYYIEHMFISNFNILTSNRLRFIQATILNNIDVSKQIKRIRFINDNIDTKTCLSIINMFSSNTINIIDDNFDSNIFKDTDIISNIYS